MRADAFIRMQQHLLETAVNTHTLVFGEIPEKRCETSLQAHGHVDPLNFEARARVEQVMSKYEVIPIQVAYGIVADAVWSVVDCLGDFGAIGAVKFVQLVGVADEEIDRAGFRTGSRRAFPQKHLGFTKVDASEGVARPK